MSVGLVSRFCNVSRPLCLFPSIHHSFCGRPTFVFLIGNAKVDQVKGANKAYVLASSSMYSSHIGGVVHWKLRYESTLPVPQDPHSLVKAKHWGAEKQMLQNLPVHCFQAWTLRLRC